MKKISSILIVLVLLFNIIPAYAVVDPCAHEDSHFITMVYEYVDKGDSHDYITYKQMFCNNCLQVYYVPIDALVLGHDFQYTTDTHINNLNIHRIYFQCSKCDHYTYRDEYCTGNPCIISIYMKFEPTHVDQ